MAAGTSGKTAVTVGYDFDFIEKLPERFKCPICFCAMRNPVQTNCGHRFCSNCLYASFSSERRKTECPEDRNPLQKEKIFPDKACHREILSLQVKCEKSKRGCDWTGELLNHKDHLTKCQYNDVICEDCNKKMQRRELGSHMTFDCLERIVHCKYCGDTFAYRCQKGHEDRECPLFPLDCPEGCGVPKMPRKEVGTHVGRYCKKKVVPCFYKGVGCTFQTERGKMDNHLQQFTRKHLHQTFCDLMETKQELKDLKVSYEKSNKEMSELKKELAQTRRDVAGIKRNNIKSQQESEQITTRLDSIENRVMQENKRINPKRKREESDEESDGSKRSILYSTYSSDDSDSY